MVSYNEQQTIAYVAICVIVTSILLYIFYKTIIQIQFYICRIQEEPLLTV